MFFVKDNNMNGIYYKLVQQVLNQGEHVNGTRELQNVSFELTNPLENITQNRSQAKYGVSLYYALGELVWYFAGSNSMKFISKFGKMWEKLSDDGKTNNSAYGYRLQTQFGFNQIKTIERLLKKDRNSRRAVLNINTPNKNVYETNDEPCTIALQFLIRNNRLNLTAIMRSNDLWFGTPYDVLFFTSLQRIIANDLKIEMGSYYHFATSMHIYERNVEDFDVHDDKYDDDITINPIKLNEVAGGLYAVLDEYDKKEARNAIVSLTQYLDII